MGDVYICELDGQAIGMFLLQKKDDYIWGANDAPAMYVHKLAILGEFAGRGIGTKILAFAEEKAKENGMSLLRLDCSEDNKNLCDYYARQGYKHVKTKVFNPTDIKELYRAAMFEKNLV